MFRRLATNTNLLLLKQQTRGRVVCSFFSTENRSSTARAHLAVLGSATDEIADLNKHSLSDPSRNHLQQQQSFLTGSAHIAQTQQSARSHALCFPRGVQQHHGFTDSFYRPERPTKQPIRFVQLQQQRRQQHSKSQSSYANTKRINRDLAVCKDASQVLQILRGLPVGALTKPAGGGVLDAVGFATAVHRVARHSAGHYKKRVAVLQDPHFALLVTALAEALDDNNSNRIVFKPQELSNIAWALAKLELPDGNDNSDTSSSLSERARVLRQALQQWQHQQRGSGDWSSAKHVESSTSMSALSQLSGHILDDIGDKVVALTTASSKNKSKPTPQHFVMQAYANLLWAWAKVDRADPVVTETVLQYVICQQKKVLSEATSNSATDGMLRPQHWSNSLWAIATSRMYHGHQNLLDFVAYLLVTYPDFLDQFQAQEISNTVWATATLLANKPEPLTDREQMSALTIMRSAAQYVLRKNAGSFKTQELANTIWSMAKLGFGLSSSAEQGINNDYVVLESDNPAGDAGMVKKLLDVIVQAALPRLLHFKSQELSNLAWSLARLVDVKTDAIDVLLDGIGRQLQHPQCKVTLQDVSNTMWSLATLKHDDEDLYRGLASRLTSQQANTYKPQELSMTVWSLATAEVRLRDRDALDTSLVPKSQLPSVRDPATAIFAITARELMRRPHEFKPQQIKDVLWSFSKVGIRHPALFQSVAKHLVGDESDNGGRVASPARGLIEFSPQELSNMAFAFALQAKLSNDVSERMKGATSLVNSSRPLPVTVYIDALLDGIGRQLQHPQCKVTSQGVSNTLWSLATMKHADEDLYRGLASRLTLQQAHAYKPQELSMAVWSLATAEVSLRDRDAFDTSLVPKSQLPSVRDPATALFATAAGELMRRPHEFSSQSIINTLWSFSKAGIRHPALFQSVAQHLVGDESVNGGNGASPARGLNEFSPQELSKMAFAFALQAKLSNDVSERMNGATSLVNSSPPLPVTVYIDVLLDAIGRKLQHPQCMVTSQDVSKTLWSLATLKHADEDLYRGLASRLTSQQANTYKPQELSMAVWSLATAEVSLRDRDAFDTSLVPKSHRPSIRDPATALFATAAGELMHRPHEFKPQEIKDVLWSFSKVGMRHPALFQSVAKHLVGNERDNDDDVASPARGLNGFSPQELSNMAYAFALQAQLSNDVSERMKGATSLVNSSRSLDVTVYSTACIDIGERLLQRFFSAIAKSSTKVMQKAKPQELANTAWAFAVLGLKDVRFMEAAKREALERWAWCVRGDVGNAVFSSQNLANFLWSHAVLNMPGRDLVAGLAPYVCSLCQDGKGGLVTVSSTTRVFERTHLANLAWSCAVFGEYPPELMNVLYTGLFGPSGKELSPAALCKIHSDQGLSSGDIRSLIYVQAVLDLADSNQSLSLPDNFPDGWRQMGQAQHHDYMTDTADRLRLSTSKLQRAVSDALSRIGFKHVQEHVITMEEMSREHGISFSPKPVEILAIDIANTYDKIAIEVDGPTHFISCIDQSSSEYSKYINGKLGYKQTWNGDRLEMDGATALKDRLLSSLRWKVIHIPFWEWNETGGDKSAEEVYCRGLLTTAGIKNLERMG